MTAAPDVVGSVAVAGGAARALATIGTSNDRLTALCHYLRNALPALEVRFRAGARRQDRIVAGSAPLNTPTAATVQVAWRDGREATLEVVGSSRAASDLDEILDAVAAIAGTLVIGLDVDDVDDLGTIGTLNRLTIDALPVGLYVVDREYRVVLWNRKRETGTQGLRRGDVLGHRVFDVLRRQPPDLLRAEFNAVFESGAPRVSEHEVRVEHDVHTYRTTRLPMRLGGDAITHVMTIGEDVTETRAIERTMHQHEKLAAVGQLAAGVMHEINNPLATIGGCAAAIAARLGSGAEPVVQEYLGIIESEVLRCNGIVDGLLDFSRTGRTTQAHELVDVHVLIERTLDLLQHHQRFRRLKVVRDFAAERRQVLAQGDRLIQAAMAILLNAADATGGRGTVTLRTSVDAETVVIEFEDDGPGVTEDALPRLFDPFFTTKGPARGTGLGLAICYGIVADHRGSITVRSRPGETVFRLVLPLASQEAA